MDKPVRKHNRIEQYNYSQEGAYFITICTKDRQRILCDISVEHLGQRVPAVELRWHGMIADHYIRQMDGFYQNLSVDKYIIMPDHIHLLITVRTGEPVPEKRTSVIARFVATFKRFCNKAYGENIWQSRYYDHVIRNQQDYDETWEYIGNNPHKWALTHHILEE